MGVLFVMPTWAAPSELWLQRMLRALKDELVGVACYSPCEATWNGVCPAFDLISRERSNEQLANAIEQTRPTAVLVHYLPFALQLERGLRSSGVAVFVHAHGYDLTWDGCRPEPPHRRRFDDGYPKQVVAMSEWATLLVASGFARERLRSVGVGDARLRLSALGVPVPDAFPERGDSSPINVLYLGRLIDFKGPEQTIAAFEVACEQGLDATLTVAGDGPLRAACEKRVERSAFRDRITLTGAVTPEQGQGLRDAADIFTAHSQTGPTSRQQETFGVGFVEAMAAGLPVVAGRSGSLPEILGDGVAGLLFSPGDIMAHAEALKSLGDNASLRERLGRAGHHRAATRYRDETAAKRLGELLKAP